MRVNFWLLAKRMPSIIENVRFLNCSFNFGNNQKSRGARSRLLGKCDNTLIFTPLLPSLYVDEGTYEAQMFAPQMPTQTLDSLDVGICGNRCVQQNCMPIDNTILIKEHTKQHFATQITMICYAIQIANSSYFQNLFLVHTCAVETGALQAGLAEVIESDSFLKTFLFFWWDSNPRSPS